MKKLLIPAALAMLVSAPAHAQQKTTLDQVMNELAALSERVGRLEQDNAQLQTENSELRASNDRLEATARDLKDEAAATRKQLAEDGPKLAEAERISKTADWASRLSWKADFRYRHEYIDQQYAASDQARQRIRARLAVSARINDTLTGTIGLATNGGSSDPRSTNQTLGDGMTRKGIGLDLAYVDWKPTGDFGMTFGKMPLPFQRVGLYLWDPDLTPEGIAARFASGPFFANAFGVWLSERSAASDATLLGGQLGLTGTVGGVKLMGALGYYDVGAVEGQVTTASAACVANPAFFGGPQGNTTVLNGAGCPVLANDFNMIEGIVQADFKVGDLPVALFAQYMENQEANDLNSGYGIGFAVGKASAPHSWEFGYAYQVTEKDAQFGQLVDSDFAGGTTDGDGSVFKVAYAPARNWVLNGAYFLNNRFVDAPGATEASYDRYQLDLNYKF